MTRRLAEITPLIAGFGALLIGFALYYVRLAGTENMIALHYVSGMGADFWGTKADALFILIAGTWIFAGNIALAGILRRRNRPLSQAIGIIAGLVPLLILGALCGIIAIN